MTEEKEIQSSAGRILEGYKQWYLRQPKSLRIVVLPTVIALAIFVIEQQTIAGWAYLVPAFLLGLNQYHSLIEADERDALTAELSSASKKRDFWRGKAEKMIYLNSVFSRLVEKKSRLYLETIDIVNENGFESGRAHVRQKASLGHNLQRITDEILNVFERLRPIGSSQKFRVTYLVPTRDDAGDRRLVAKVWSNNENAPPSSVSNVNNDHFLYGDGTFAGNLWAQEGSDFRVIEDVQSYIDGQGGSFVYTHQPQRMYLRAILGQKVIDPAAKQCLGIICVDTDYPNSFDDNDGFLQATMESFAKRIVFETRVSSMKKLMNARDPYTPDQGEKT